MALKSFRIYWGPTGASGLATCAVQGVLALSLSLPLLFLGAGGVLTLLLFLPAAGLAVLTFGIGHLCIAVFCVVAAWQAWRESASLPARAATVAVDVAGAAAAGWVALVTWAAA